MEAPKIKVLVIIPAYNAAQFIGAAIKSVYRQTYQHVQLVVVNDCSTDNTAAIATSQGATVLNTQVNGGCYAAVNLALHTIAGFDAWYVHGSDDVSYPTLVEKLVGPLNNDPSLVFTWCNFSRIEYDTGFVHPPVRGYRASTVMYARKVFNTIGYYDNTRYGGDTEYWDRAMLFFNPQQTLHINEVLINATLHGKNLTRLVNVATRQQYVQQYKLRHQNIHSYNYKQYNNRIS